MDIFLLATYFSMVVFGMVVLLFITIVALYIAIKYFLYKELFRK